MSDLFFTFFILYLEFSHFFCWFITFLVTQVISLGDGVPKGSVAVTFYVFFLMIWHPFLLSLQTVT